MSERKTRVVAAGFSFLEGVRWHDDRLWVSEVYGNRVLSVTPSGQVDTVAVVPGMPSGLGWLPDGRLLIVSMRDRRLLRRERDGSLRQHADLSAFTPWFINDMLVTPDGWAYVGGVGYDHLAGTEAKPADLFGTGVDGSARVAAEGLDFPNGMALIENAATLLVAESAGHRISAFSRHDDGTLSDRREWAALPDVEPDGMSAAGDDTVWVADSAHHRVVRVERGGRIVDEISTGSLHAFTCALGGDTLFVCAAPSYRGEGHEAVVLATEI
ncbi:SMP-30/gluconolactonase/LRE family protein [Actinoplanes sp. TBRC 11911]|uniref:SMP-30/gluconolactonase/LRE family protein n=1 Tax=Actinoplanes sp. TBRC 11911 TaxID=2729386 RepID=UPI00145C579A|nr:SMP-30/gluconolactonase/LRE family protein [Actinoplanes sp. TBRC 11911]NMO53708.1 SMP-30/gluconolactonase/LRE family protein [Actinoplanes sp. TBRC 11911]